MEGSAVARASGPPVIGAVDERVTGRLAVVCVDKVLDPTDHRGL